MTVYFSEIRFENSEDFVEIVATDGEDLSGYSTAVYDDSGGLKYTHSLSGDYETTFAGTDGYVVDRADGLPDMGNNWGVALIDATGSVVQFISSDTEITASDGPAAGETSMALGNMTSGGESVATNDDTTYYAESSPNPGTIPCLARGTLIDTPDGPRPVETPRPGDLVDTLHDGAVPVLWSFCSTHWLDGPRSEGLPILISAGALGPGHPQSDLVISPHHRVLVGGDMQLHKIFTDRCLVPAKALTGLPGIREMRGKKHITWVHFACNPHHVVTSNGCLTESLLLGPMVTNRLTARQTLHLAQVFGRSGGDGWNGPLALPAMTVGAARRIIDRWRHRSRQAA